MLLAHVGTGRVGFNECVRVCINRSSYLNDTQLSYTNAIDLPRGSTSPRGPGAGWLRTARSWFLPDTLASRGGTRCCCCLYVDVGGWGVKYVFLKKIINK